MDAHDPVELAAKLLVAAVTHAAAVREEERAAGITIAGGIITLSTRRERISALAAYVPYTPSAKPLAGFFTVGDERIPVHPQDMSTDVMLVRRAGHLTRIWVPAVHLNDDEYRLYVLLREEGLDAGRAVDAARVLLAA